MTYKTAREVIAHTIDATFTRRGFNAETHADAVLAALGVAGYRIVAISAEDWAKMLSSIE